MTIDEMKAWIDTASYQALLSRWRFAPIGSPWFQGELGDYYALAMARKRAALGDDEHVRVSKSIGWPP